MEASQANPQQAPAEGDERAAFEAWCPSQKLSTNRFRLGHDLAGEYYYQSTVDAWAAWQARAAHASQVQPKGKPAPVSMCSEQAVLHALTMARSEAHQQGEAALWQAFGRAMWRQFNAMAPSPAEAHGAEPAWAFEGDPEEAPCNAFPICALCATCGSRWGLHVGALCPTEDGRTFQPAQPRHKPPSD